MLRLILSGLEEIHADITILASIFFYIWCEPETLGQCDDIVKKHKMYIKNTIKYTVASFYSIRP